MAATAQTEEVGVPMGPALTMLIDLNLSVRDKDLLETTLKAKRRWSQLEVTIASLIKRKRFVAGECDAFGMTQKEADIVTEYMKYVKESAGRMLWRELDLDHMFVTPAGVVSITAAQDNAPMTPPGIPAERAASSGLGDPRPLVPPGMEDLPNFDRKSLCSSKEIVLKGVDTMSADELRVAIDKIMGPNEGLAHVHVIEGRNIGFARFWTAEATSRAIEQLKALKNAHSGRRIGIERCTYKKHHHDIEDK